MRTKIDALYDLVHKMNGAGVKDDSIVEMIDQVTKAYDNGGGGGDNYNTYALVSGEGFYETTKTEITNENDIAELEKIRNLFFENGTIPTIVIGERAEDGNTNMTVLKGYYIISTGTGKLDFDVFEEGDPVTYHNISRRASNGNVKWYATQMDL